MAVRVGQDRCSCSDLACLVCWAMIGQRYDPSEGDVVPSSAIPGHRLIDPHAMAASCVIVNAAGERAHSILDLDVRVVKGVASVIGILSRSVHHQGRTAICVGYCMTCSCLVTCSRTILWAMLSPCVSSVKTAANVWCRCQRQRPVGSW